jgi:hypothetical protein
MAEYGPHTFYTLLLQQGPGPRMAMKTTLPHMTASRDEAPGSAVEVVAPTWLLPGNRNEPGHSLHFGHAKALVAAQGFLAPTGAKEMVENHKAWGRGRSRVLNPSKAATAAERKAINALMEAALKRSMEKMKENAAAHAAHAASVVLPPPPNSTAAWMLAKPKGTPNSPVKTQ